MIGPLVILAVACSAFVYGPAFVGSDVIRAAVAFCGLLAAGVFPSVSLLLNGSSIPQTSVAQVQEVFAMRRKAVRALYILMCFALGAALFGLLALIDWPQFDLSTPSAEEPQSRWFTPYVADIIGRTFLALFAAFLALALNQTRSLWTTATSILDDLEKRSIAEMRRRHEEFAQEVKNSLIQGLSDTADTSEQRSAGSSRVG